MKTGFQRKRSVAPKRVSPSAVESWISTALTDGLSPASVRNYHAMLKTIFQRAVRERVLASTPWAASEPPKAVGEARTIPTREDVERLLSEIPPRWRLMVLVGIETGLRWGELAALRPRHIDVPRCLVHVRETIVEVPKKMSPTGERMILKDYPKDNQHRTLTVGQPLTELISAHAAERRLSRDHVLLPSTLRLVVDPLSRNTFRTSARLPALKHSDFSFQVGVHDARHAHASWLLAGGADLRWLSPRMWWSSGP